MKPLTLMVDPGYVSGSDHTNLYMFFLSEGLRAKKRVISWRI